MHTDCIPPLGVSSPAPLAFSSGSHCWSTSRAGKARTTQSPSLLPSIALDPNGQGKRRLHLDQKEITFPPGGVLIQPCIPFLATDFTIPSQL